MIPPDTSPLKWATTMHWHDLLFAHWPVAPEALARQLPRTDPPLELDLFDGQAWLGIVPFRMSGIHWRGLPAFPSTGAFLELNVRTYVRAAGRSGVWFFSLDAASKLAVRMARWAYHLPYFDAAMELRRESGETIHYGSHRTHRGGGTANFEASYRPVGPAFSAQLQSFEHWVVERYRLFAARPDGRLRRVEISHASWRLQRATADFRILDLTRQWGFELPAQNPHLLFAREMAVRAGWLLPA